MKNPPSNGLALSLVSWVISRSEPWNYCWLSIPDLSYFSWTKHPDLQVFSEIWTASIPLYSVSRKRSLQVTVLDFSSILFPLDHPELFILQVYDEYPIYEQLCYLQTSARNINHDITRKPQMTLHLHQLYLLPRLPESYLRRHLVDRRPHLWTPFPPPEHHLIHIFDISDPPTNDYTFLHNLCTKSTKDSSRDI